MFTVCKIKATNILIFKSFKLYISKNIFNSTGCKTTLNIVNFSPGTPRSLLNGNDSIPN